MNIHPIFVHFPIALLLFWSIIEIVNPGKWIKSIDFISVQKILLSLGFVFSLVTLSTGEQAEELLGSTPLIEMHSTIATTTVWLYGLFVFDLILKLKIVPESLKKIFIWYSDLFANKYLRIFLALFALICLFLTGLLGGAIVFGNSADPLTPYILSWLGL